MPTIDFNGKQFIRGHHLTVPIKTLEIDGEKSFTGESEPSLDDNLIIHGDNLNVLKALLPRYANSIKCIYIDPPYNTGNEEWVYNDNVNSTLMQEWLKKNSPIDGEDLERHDKWLCMMWPRLNLLKELLSDNGVIFISIDDNEVHRLRMLMDEIFGEGNFVANIVWHHRKSSQNDIDISLSHNHILCYALEKTSFTFNAEDVDESKFSNPDKDPRGPWVADPMDAPHIRENLTYEITNPNTGKVYLPPSGRHWRFSKEKYDIALREKRIIFGKRGTSKPQYKRFLSEAREKGVNIFTIWSDVGTATDGTKELISIFGRGQLFSTPKPTDLIGKIIRVSMDKNDIILDAFAGSGTTAHAALALNKEDGGNRKFILIEHEKDYVSDITAERVRRVINGVENTKDQNLKDGLGGSFTYCTLGETIDEIRILTGEPLPDYETVANYIAFVTTGKREFTPIKKRKDYCFGETENILFYLIYESELAFMQSRESALNYELARKIENACKNADKKAYVYASHKNISQKDLTDMQITFCQLPYNIYRIKE
ncbi:MAG: site-specific DNA-methyltransferase [Candidatus Poribacteria bacterium]|nr:site-specific DNA-methyltransferase [Candidatus Poribacteria bacterium]